MSADVIHLQDSMKGPSSLLRKSVFHGSMRRLQHKDILEEISEQVCERTHRLLLSKIQRCLFSISKEKVQTVLPHCSG